MVSFKIWRQCSIVAILLLITPFISTSHSHTISPSNINQQRRPLTQLPPPHETTTFHHPQTKQHQQPLIPPSGGSQSSSSPSASLLTKQLSGAAYFIALDVALKKVLQQSGINFPSMMAGCILLFVVMVLVEIARPGWGDAAFELLNPGATFLASWFAVFFVPGLVLLPLAPKVGSAFEVIKVLSVVCVGFFFSVLTTSYSVFFLRQMQGKISNADDDDDLLAFATKEFDKGKSAVLSAAARAIKDGTDSVVKASQKGKDATIAAASDAAKKGRNKVYSAATKASKEVQASVTTAAFKAAEKKLPPRVPAKPYSEEQVRKVAIGSAVAGILTIYAHANDNPFAKPLETFFMILTTIGSYMFGARLPTNFNKVVHPIVTSTLTTLLAADLIGRATSRTSIEVLQSYKTNSLSPMNTGAGDILLFLLGPAVCGLSIPMYSRKRLMSENLSVVVISTLVSSIGGLFSTAAYVRLINLSGDVLRLSVLTRNVTTALAMVITKMLGGDIAICASICVLTGIFGATVGARCLTALGLHDPVSRGLGIGGASFALGAASIVNEKDAFPFAAIGMVLTAVCSTCLASVPGMMGLLTSVAVGDGGKVVTEGGAAAASV